MKEAAHAGGESLANAQQELLDLLVAMEDVEPQFQSRGKTEATYTVHLINSNIPPLLWVYADGRIFACWNSFRKTGNDAAADRMKRLWASYVNAPGNFEGSNTIDRVGQFRP